MHLAYIIVFIPTGIRTKDPSPLCPGLLFNVEALPLDLLDMKGIKLSFDFFFFLTNYALTNRITYVLTRTRTRDSSSLMPPPVVCR